MTLSTLLVPKTLTIASRKSPLAIWQSEHVAHCLRQHYPDTQVSILGLSTQGDEILDQQLSKIGGKGLFTKTLETAMYQKQADLAVHSLKDVPMQLPSFEQDFQLAAILPRGTVNDALISQHYNHLDALPAGAVVGTSSLRRVCALKRHYPHLKTALLRGNINTRLDKLAQGQYDAIILAAAGLERLGLSQHIKQYIPLDIMPPAPAQAALAVEIYGQTHQRLLSVLNHHPTFLACLAERQISKILGGSCQVPIAAYAHWRNAQQTTFKDLASNILDVYACVFDETGGIIQAQQSLSMQVSAIDLSTHNTVDEMLLMQLSEQAQLLGTQVAQQLIAQGAVPTVN